MLTIQGIYNGKNIELSETAPFRDGDIPPYLKSPVETVYL